MSEQVGEHAVVLGASMAGLLAARVLADSYQQVTVVDRDRLAEDGLPRRAVPQGHHIHALLARGQQIFEELFPGFTDDLSSAGVPLGDFGANLRWYFNGRMLQKPRTGLVCVSAGRPILENSIRARMRGLSNVSIMEQVDIGGLVATSDRARITGVRLANRSGGSETTLDADLVVDATGRGSRSPKWLVDLGYPQVEEEQVKMGLTYTTCHYRMPMPSDPFGDDVGIIPVATPENPRGAIFARFADRYALSLTGILGDRPPTDPEGFLAYTKSLPIPDIYEAVREAEPIDEPVAFHFPASVRRRYERMERFPDGLLVTGDAACIFNPVYGQGMTVAALDSLILQRHLQDGTAPQPGPFFQDLAAVIDPPWDMSAGTDLGFPGVEGKRSIKVKMGNAFIPRLQSAAVEDSALSEAFLRAAGLIDPPEALSRPEIMVRVMQHRPPRPGTAPVVAASR